jgi:uncharacterized protein
MRKLLTFALVGFGAQLVDGSLGMAYGASSATLLVATGYSPALASASIHLAEVATTLASGVSHWRFGNVDWTVVRRMALPGAVGGFVGATLLSSIDGDAVKPWVAAILLFLGVLVLVRFASRTGRRPRRSILGTPAASGLGAVAGFVDAVGGGGWGPVATPTLLTTTRMEPRKVIGSVDTSEFVVALGASAGFLAGLGRSGIDVTLVVALMGGGLVAAPVAAWCVRRLPTEILGVAVGGLLILTNAHTLAPSFDLPLPVVTPLVLAPWTVIMAGVLVRRRRDQRGTQASEPCRSASTGSGSSPSSRSARLTSSTTDRTAALTATHNAARDSTSPS